ncbi:MAG: TIGR03790 family protein [Planctomycetia bacterium]|nr:TIGR03790 family protein [Planctomycetia bacterium]
MVGKTRWTSIRAVFELLERRDLLTADLVAANVLVLYNTASPNGAQIANYYAQIHPGVQLLGINGVDPNSEDISADDYLSIIRPQVLSGLTTSTTEIDVIVTTKGLPLRITVGEPEPPVVPPNPLPTYVDPSGTTRSILSWRPTSSLESELTAIDTISIWQQMGDQSFQIPGQFTNNPYFRKSGAFSHAAFGDRLAARLDGYSVSDVEASLDRAQNAFIGPHNSPSGPFWFLVDNDPTISYAPTMANLVNNVLNPAGMPVVYDNTITFVGTAAGPVIGYDSHGIHQASTPGANYIVSGLNIMLANGAVFNSWESFNAATFNPTGDTHNQGQVAQWLQKGGTAGVGNVAEPWAGVSYMANEDQLFSMLINGKTFVEAAWSAIPQLSYVTTVVGDPLMTWKTLPPASTIVGRYIFYNNSFWDGNDPTANAADDASIATDKSAYIPNGTAATFATVSSYDKGINGVMIDLQGGGNHASITLANISNDFTFKLGNDNTPGSWSTAPGPTSVAVRLGAGFSGSDRVELIWADRAIQNRWLEVIAKANADTGLTVDDVFFFGNEEADTGVTNTATVAKVGSGDVTGVQTNGANIGANIPATNLYDFNRDGKVDSSDVTFAQTHGTSTRTGLQLINLAANGPLAPVSAAAPAAGSAVGMTVSLAVTSPSPTVTVIPTWIVNRLRCLESNRESIAKYFEHLAHESTTKSREIRVQAGHVADPVNLALPIHDLLRVKLRLE